MECRLFRPPTGSTGGWPGSCRAPARHLLAVLCNPASVLRLLWLCRPFNRYSGDLHRAVSCGQVARLISVSGRVRLCAVVRLRAVVVAEGDRAQT